MEMADYMFMSPTNTAVAAVFGVYIEPPALPPSTVIHINSSKPAVS
jgi:hypothetical protein